ncbi:hypothetical protein DQ04_00901060 [Trypanosoma grayi]|uniref:hypothetical protein n=1 Tax=Trypanosoma grayi TaxID=71804 RepID=UPI0004F47D61|nr:hypothetical protein DQ04_00901060 [Trypanosoma grayi]KEG13604.1 hypothetical protein DQ04_00901060 [Trypanosoma grayi]
MTRAKRAVTQVSLALLLLLLFVVDDVNGGMQKQQPVHRGDSATAKFIRVVQVVSSFTEKLFNKAEPQTWIDEIKRLARMDLRAGEAEENKVATTVATEMARGTKGRNYLLSESQIGKPASEADAMELDEEVPSGDEDEENEWEGDLLRFSAKAEPTPERRCSRGYVAVPGSTVFSCNDTNVTGAAYSNLTEEERGACTHAAETDVVCICPLGTIWQLKGASQGWVCAPRLLLASPRLTNTALCRDEHGGALGLPRSSESDYCVRVRRSATLALNLNVTYRWMENDEMENIIALKEPQAAFGTVERDGVYVTLRKGVLGKYSELERSGQLFSFILAPDSSDPYSFGMISGHPLQKDGQFDFIIYPFNHPELMDRQKVSRPLKTGAALKRFFGGKGNYTLHSVTKDLGTLSDEYITGNTMYMEVGFSSSGLPFEYRCARVWITFEGLPEAPETYSYDQPMSSATIAAIIISSAVSLGVLAAVVWYFCNKPQEFDDRLIEKALKERSKKEQ